MKINECKRKENTISLSIEISPEEITKQYPISFKKISKNRLVPGFRKGKASLDAYVKRFGDAEITQEATIAAVNQAYLDTLKEKELDVVDNPTDINIGEYKKDKPLEFTCNVDVKPLIKLGKYKGIKVKKELKKVDKKAIEAELLKLQENAATFEIVEREIKERDLVLADVKATENETPYEPWTKTNYAIQLGNSLFGADFDKKLLKKSKNTEETFDISYPKDFNNPDVADKKITFSLKIQEIKEKKLPELTDAFIEKNSQFKTVKEVEEKVKENLTTQYEKECSDKLKEDILKTVLEPIKIDIPDGLLKQESEYELRQYSTMLKQSGLTLDKYLELSAKTKEDLFVDIKPTVETRVKTELVLDQLSKTEKIDVSEDEQLIEIKTANPSIKTDDEAKKLLNKIDKYQLNFHIKQKKAIQFLIDNAKIA